MSLFHENIKQILTEVDKFLQETLKKEKLNKKSIDHKQLILDKLTKFYEENPTMKIAQDNISLPDESSWTGGSSKSDESEDTIYNESGIALVPASEIKDHLFAAYMEKKQRKGTGLFGSSKFQTRWCIIQAGIFYYYIKPEDKKQAGSFRLDNYKFRNAPDLSSKKKEKETCFELYQTDEAKRVYQFMAKNKDDYDNCQNFVESGGLPLIEEDLYEELDTAAPPQSPTTPKPDEPSDDESETYEIPEEKQVTSGPTPPKSKTLQPPPPPPPSSLKKSPVMTPKAPLPEPPEADEIYDEALSTPAPVATPAVPNRQKLSTATAPVEDTPAPVPSRPKLPPAPEPPAVNKRQRPNRDLPELPAPKKKIKINLTCLPEDDFENRFHGMWDCKGEGKNELSFKKGDIVYVVSKEFDDKSWWIGELNGKFGLVPKNYLTPAFVFIP